MPTWKKGYFSSHRNTIVYAMPMPTPPISIKLCFTLIIGFTCQFTPFYISVKKQKSRFKQVFGVHSVQMLVETYNN